MELATNFEQSRIFFRDLNDIATEENNGLVKISATAEMVHHIGVLAMGITQAADYHKANVTLNRGPQFCGGQKIRNATALVSQFVDLAIGASFETSVEQTVLFLKDCDQAHKHVNQGRR